MSRTVFEVAIWYVPYVLVLEVWLISSVVHSGGGVSGLAVAAFLSRRPDILVRIYEAKPEISDIGAGIAIWKRTWEVLVDLGLDEELLKRNLDPPKDGEGIF